MKKCSQCKIEKELNDFHKSKRYKDGHCYVCKQCRSEYAPNYRDKNREKLRLYKKQWIKDNKEHVLEVSSLYKKKWKQEKTEMYLLGRSRIRARKLGMEHNLTIEDIIIPENCPILDIKLFVSDNPQNYNSPTLDRIDNTKGYIKGNVIVVSWRANSLKSNASLQEIQKVANFYRKFLNE